jgi:hypothetical protein
MVSAHEKGVRKPQLILLVLLAKRTSCHAQDKSSQQPEVQSPGDPGKNQTSFAHVPPVPDGAEGLPADPFQHKIHPAG